jgi:PAS domain S-box-containing protein
MTDPARPTIEQLEAENASLRQRVADLEADLTAQHAVEQTAQTEHRYAEHIVETVHEPLLMLSGDLRVLTANPAFYRLFNVTPQETEGVLLYELGNQQWNIPQLRQLLEDLLPTHTTIDNFEVTHTFLHLGCRTMRLNACRFQLDGDDTAQILLAIDDITTYKEAEAALQDQRDWFDGTLSSIGEGVIATDVHGNIIFLNPVAEVLTGWSLAQARSRPLAEVFRIINEHTRQPMADDPVNRVLREGRVVGLANHTLLITHYGAEIPIADSAAPIRDQHGVLHGVVLVFRDGTAMRQLENQLYEKQKMEALGTLAGGIAHGFNNMLAAILGFSTLLRNEVASDSRAAAYLHEVNAAGLRAKDLVQQMLAFSRRDVQARHAFELRLLVHETLRLLRASLPTTVELRVQLNTHGNMIQANPTQMQQVLMNLAANAEYAMRPTGGILEIRLEEVDITPPLAARHANLQPGPHLCLTVQDTGPGMPPEVLARIFEPFFTTKPVGEGTGMGLAIVHGIITSHGGAITAASTPGQGTTLTIYLPQLARPLLPVAPSSPLALAPPPRGNERLLVVEDDIALVRLAEEQLSALGYAVRVCSSSGEALTLFQADPQAFDLVLTDQTMPHMTGDVLAQEMRRLRPELPLILISGYSPLIDAARVQALGIDAFLLKPLSLHELAQTIRQVLAQRREQQS